MWSLFDTTGRFVQSMICEPIEAQWTASLIGGSAVLVNEPATGNDYYTGGAVVPRPQLPALPPTIVAGTIVTVDELPNGASVRIEDDERFTVGQGVIEDHAIPMRFGYPGTFTVHIGEGDTAFPYLPRSYSVTVVDP